MDIVFLRRREVSRRGGVGDLGGAARDREDSNGVAR